MLDYTSKRLLDKLLNKVWPDDLGIKSPVKSNILWWWNWWGRSSSDEEQAIRYVSGYVVKKRKKKLSEARCYKEILERMYETDGDDDDCIEE